MTRTNACTLLAAAVSAVVISLWSMTASAQTLNGCMVNGETVPSVTNPMLPDVAMAGFQPGFVRTIFVNPQAAAYLSPLMKEFVYWHECGHHVLHHADANQVGMGRPYVDEQQADCYAIRHLVSVDGISDAQVTALQIEAGRVLGQAGDGTHLPAAIREMNLRECLRVSRSNLGDGPATARHGLVNRCHTELRPHVELRPQTIFVTQWQPRAVPYCPYGPYRPCVTMTRMVPVQVPVVRNVSITVTTPQTICDDSAGTSGATASDDGQNTEASSTSSDETDGASTTESERPKLWRYEYLFEDDWRKSTTFHLEDSCKSAQARRERSGFTTIDCYEVDDD